MCPGSSSREEQHRSIFVSCDKGGYRLKDNVQFHLYISTSPCGDARIFSPHEAGVEGTPLLPPTPHPSPLWFAAAQFPQSNESCCVVLLYCFYLLAHSPFHSISFPFFFFSLRRIQIADTFKQDGGN